jgi:hypothetical protein
MQIRMKKQMSKFNFQQAIIWAVIAAFTGFSFTYQNEKKITVCGKVKERFIESNNEGVGGKPIYNLIIYSDSLGKKIPIEVEAEIFFTIKLDQVECISTTKGNLDKMLNKRIPTNRTKSTSQ